MEWFKGSIADAVQSVKKSKQNLLILYTDTDTINDEIKDIFDSEEVISLCNKNLNLHLILGTESGQQFTEIYPVTVVPSIFLVNFSGDIVFELQTIYKDTFVEKLKANDIILPTSSNSSVNIAENNLHERLNYARAMQERVKIKKDIEEKEKNKQKEIERRDLGKKMTEFKDLQEETVIRERQAQIKKDAMLNTQLRQQVLQDIESRKRERNTQDRVMPLVTDSITSTSVTNSAAVYEKGSQTRIQFRLPDNKTFYDVFENDSTLRSLFDFVCQNSQESYLQRGYFRLSQFHPKKDFSETDMDSTLEVLNLVPSATLCISKLNKDEISSLPLSRQNVVTVIGNFIQWILGYLWSFVQTRPSVPSKKNDGPNIVANKGSVNAEESSGIKRRRGHGGDIARLNDEADDDEKKKSKDPNATWNGNSTQQM